eukprot:COSAG01_NODE_6545_length_3613_cov_53.783722_2_plen_199_part_00
MPIGSLRANTVVPTAGSRCGAGLVLNVQIFYENNFKATVCRPLSGGCLQCMSFNGVWKQRCDSELGSTTAQGSLDSDIYSYFYKVQHITGTEYKGAEVVYGQGNTQTRLNRDRHGIRIVFSVTGRIGHFEIFALMTQLAIATSLFGMSVAVVDRVMIWVMKDREWYKGYKCLLHSTTNSCTVVAACVDCVCTQYCKLA